MPTPPPANTPVPLVEAEPPNVPLAQAEPDAFARLFITQADAVNQVSSAPHSVEVDVNLIAEAQKDATTRQEEIAAALEIQNSSDVAPCIEFGHNMLAQSAQPRFGDDMQILGASVNDALQHYEPRTLDDAIQIIGERIESLSHGQESILRPVDDKADLQIEGARRRAGQRELQNLRAVTLGLSSRAFETGDYRRAIDALQASGVGIAVGAAPSWYYDQVANALVSANLEDAGVRVEVLRIEKRGMCGIAHDDRESVVGDEPASSRRRIAQVAFRAREIQTREEVRIAQEQAEHVYQTRLSEAWNEKMNESVNDGEHQFTEHLRGGRDYQVRFAQSRGSQMLYLISQDYPLIAEVNQDRSAGGAMGYIDTLGRMIDTPGFMDKAIKMLSEKVYSDLGGKSKSDYESAGKLVDWESHLRQQVMSEIYGNLFGCLKSTIQMEDTTGGWAPAREALVNRILMVVGREKAESGLILGQTALSQEQSQFRNALIAYTNSLKVVPDDPRTHRNAEYLKRVLGLRAQAKKADGDFKAEQLQRETAVKRKLEAEEEERQGLANKAKESKAKLESVREKREKMLDAKVRGYHCRTLEDANAEDYIIVVKGKYEKTPIVTVIINEERKKALTERRQRVDEGLQQVDLVPVRRRELRDEQAECDIEFQFIQRIELSLKQLNAPAHRRQRQGKGLMAGQVGAIANDAFAGLPGVDTRPYNIIGSGWSDEINQATEEIDHPRSRSAIKSYGTINDLSSMVDTQIATSDPLAVRSEILNVVDDILRRDVQAGSTLRELDGKVSQALEAVVRVFIQEKLHQNLVQGGHLQY